MTQTHEPSVNMTATSHEISQYGNCVNIRKMRLERPVPAIDDFLGHQVGSGGIRSRIDDQGMAAFAIVPRAPFEFDIRGQLLGCFQAFVGASSSSSWVFDLHHAAAPFASPEAAEACRGVSGLWVGTWLYKAARVGLRKEKAPEMRSCLKLKGFVCWS